MIRRKRPTHRIRRCNGNREAWLLVVLRDDGSELESFGSYTTGMSIDSLLREQAGRLFLPGDTIELVYWTPENSAYSDSEKAKR